VGIGAAVHEHGDVPMETLHNEVHEWFVCVGSVGVESHITLETDQIILNDNDVRSWLLWEADLNVDWESFGSRFALRVIFHVWKAPANEGRAVHLKRRIEGIKCLLEINCDVFGQKYIKKGLDHIGFGDSNNFHVHDVLDSLITEPLAGLCDILNTLHLLVFIRIAHLEESTVEVQAKSVILIIGLLGKRKVESQFIAQIEPVKILGSQFVDVCLPRSFDLGLNFLDHEINNMGLEHLLDIADHPRDDATCDLDVCLLLVKTELYILDDNLWNQLLCHISGLSVKLDIEVNGNVGDQSIDLSLVAHVQIRSCVVREKAHGHVSHFDAEE